MILSQKINGKITKEEAMQVHFDKSYDIIVVGLGTAGAIAALKASELSLKVLGIETLNRMGGMGTVGGITSYYFGSKGGYYEKIDEKMTEMRSIYLEGTTISAYAKEYVLETEAKNVDIKYESKIIGVYLEKNKVTGVKWLDNGKIRNTACKYIIDSTGDAYICEICGCETTYGRDSDKKMQPFTSVRSYISEENKLRNSNHDSGLINQFDPQELTNCIISAHADWLEEDYSQSGFLRLNSLIGIREGTRIIGEELPTLGDLLFGKINEKTLFYATADLDKHGLDYALDSEILNDWTVAANLGSLNVCVPVPLGSLIPKGYEGILAAGRCLSVSRDLSTCIRMERDMQKCGEAAAVIAFSAIKDGYIDYNKLKDLLTESGCYDQENDIGYHFGFPGNKEPVKINFLTNFDEIESVLKTTAPGVAIWSAYLLNEKIKPCLKEWQTSDNDNLRKHSAIALGLLRDEACLPVIREMITGRDSLMLTDCRKKNQIRLHIAMYIAGKLCDTKITDELIDIITNDNEFSKPMYSDTSLLSKHHDIKDFNYTIFQSFSHSAVALKKISESCDKALKKKITLALKTAFHKDYIKKITAKNENAAEYIMTKDLEDYIL